MVPGKPGDLIFPLISLPRGRIFIGKNGGIMKKLLIVSAVFLFVAGFISMAWAHGPNRGGGGFRSHGYSKPYFTRSAPRSFRGHHQHHGHSHLGSLPFPRRNHLPHGSVSRQSHRLPRIENGVIHSKPGPIQSKQFNSLPGKTLGRKGTRQVPHHSHSPRVHRDKHSGAWFHYGKEKQLRQLGILPPLPHTSQGSE